ncbi:MAG: hypothetical protein GEV06_16390 [Luteitalea sp.]|nr:hypothetical protein [Luteitalea sp.]
MSPRLIGVLLALFLPAHTDGIQRAPLLAREDWRETPAARPVTQAHVAHPDLRLLLFGPGNARIKKSHHDQPADDPYYVWSGEALDTWAVGLRHRAGLVDLSRGGSIRWRSRQSGFRNLHLIVQLADGGWLVSDQSEPASDDWRVRELDVADLTWRTLDAATISEGRPVKRPPLERIAATGFTDVMRGGGTPASSRLDWIEIYGYLVPW